MSGNPIPQSWRVLLEDPVGASRCYIKHTKGFHWETSDHEKQFRRRLEHVLKRGFDRTGKISTSVFENELLGHLGSIRHESLHSGVERLSPDQVEERQREEFETDIYEQKSYRSVPELDD
jgi:hypothetical protein